MGGVSLYLLQLPQFYKETGISDVLFFGIGLGFVIAVFTIVNLRKAKSKSPIFTRGTVTVPKPERKYSKSSIRDAARDIGLNKAQKKMLDFVMRNDNATDPGESLRTPELLDRHFKRAYRTLQRSARSEEDAQEKISVLYSTRNILEAVMEGNNISSTRQIPDKTDAIFMINGNDYPVKVISAKGNHLLVEHPRNMGSPVPLAQNTKVSLSFFSKSSKGFSVESRVAGLLNNGPEGPRVQIFHSSQISGSSKRRFRRRHISIPATFYFVRVEETGSRNKTRMVVDRRKLSGSIMDISIGGCSILTKASVPSGTRLKIEFAQDKTTVAALGQALRTNRNGLDTVMHIKFLKISRKSLNAINTLVFDYTDV